MFTRFIELSLFGVYIPIEVTVSALCIASYLLCNRLTPQFVQQCRRTTCRGARRSQ